MQVKELKALKVSLILSYTNLENKLKELTGKVAEDLENVNKKEEDEEEEQEEEEEYTEENMIFTPFEVENSGKMLKSQPNVLLCCKLEAFGYTVEQKIYSPAVSILHIINIIYLEC